MGHNYQLLTDSCVQLWAGYWLMFGYLDVQVTDSACVIAVLRGVLLLTSPQQIEVLNSSCCIFAPKRLIPKSLSNVDILERS